MGRRTDDDIGARALVMLPPPRSKNVADIDEIAHARGFEMHMQRVPMVQIREDLGLTHKQFSWLRDTGNAEFPSWKKMALQESIEARELARKTAKTVARKGGAAIEANLDNTIAANTFITNLMAHMQGKIDSGTITVEQALGNRDAMEWIKTMKGLSSPMPAADAFRMMYGTSVNHQILYANHDAPNIEAGIDGTVVEQVAENRDNFLPQDVLNSIVDEQSEWTDEEREMYVQTGEEPNPKV